MGVNEEKIALIVEAVNRFKGTFDELANSLKGVDDQHTRTGQKSESMFSKLKKNWLEISVAGYEAAKTIREAWEYMEKGAKAQQAEESFRAVATAAGESADEILEAMKRAANGTMDDSTIMQKAVKGMVQGLSGNQMVQVLEASRVAARVAGTDVKTAYEEITNAIANKMPRALRQYGLVTQDQMKLLEASMSAGITTVDLYALAMANGAEQAKKLGGAQQNNAETLQHWKTVFEEVEEYIGNTLWKVFNSIDDWFKNNPTKIREWAAALVETFTVIKAEIMRLAMLLDKVGGTLTSGGMLLYGPGAALGNKNSKAQFEKLAAANIEYENRYNATDKELQDMAVALDKRLEGILKPTSAKSDVASPWKTAPAASTYSGPSVKELEEQMKSNMASKMREAEIQREIANLDIGEKERSISHIDAAQKRVDLANQLLKTQEANLALIDKNAVGGAQAWAAQQKAIDDTKKKISDFRLALRELDGDFQAGFKEGLLRYIDMVGGAFKQAVELAQATAQAMQQAFSDFFFDIMTNKLRHFSDYVKGFLESIARAIANMMAQQAAAGIASGIAGLFSGGGMSSGATGVASPGSAIPAHHSGGMILHQGGYVPRFHFGGLMPDERPAILQTGEGVLSRRGMAALDALNGGQAGGGNTNVTVEVVNKSSQAVKATQGPMKFDLRGAVVSVILEDLEGNGPLRQAGVGGAR